MHCDAAAQTHRAPTLVPPAPQSQTRPTPASARWRNREWWARDCPAVSVNGEPLDAEAWAETHTGKATSDDRITPWQWDRYDYQEHWARRHDHVFEEINRLHEEKKQATGLSKTVALMQAAVGARRETMCHAEMAAWEYVAILYFGGDFEFFKKQWRSVDKARPRHASRTAALTYLVMSSAPMLGVGFVRLDVAEDRDEDLAARARLRRLGVQTMPAKQSASGSTGGTKGESALQDDLDLRLAIDDAALPVEDLALVLAVDVGRWERIGKPGKRPNGAPGPQGWELTKRSVASLAAETGAEPDAMRERVRKARKRLDTALAARGLTPPARERTPRRQAYDGPTLGPGSMPPPGSEAWQ